MITKIYNDPGSFYKEHRSDLKSYLRVLGARDFDDCEEILSNIFVVLVGNNFFKRKFDNKDHFVGTLLATSKKLLKVYFRNLFEEKVVMVEYAAALKLNKEFEDSEEILQEGHDHQGDLLTEGCKILNGAGYSDLDIAVYVLHRLQRLSLNKITGYVQDRYGVNYPKGRIVDSCARIEEFLMGRVQKS